MGGHIDHHSMTFKHPMLTDICATDDHFRQRVMCTEKPLLKQDYMHWMTIFIAGVCALDDLLDRLCSVDPR